MFLTPSRMTGTRRSELLHRPLSKSIIQKIRQLELTMAATQKAWVETASETKPVIFLTKFI